MPAQTRPEAKKATEIGRVLARKHIDQLTRDLLAARRGLWLAGQARR